MHIVLSVTADADLDETLRFYRAPSHYSDMLAAAFERATSHLAAWPYTGHRRHDLTSKNVCFWYEDPWLIVFQVTPDTLSIVAVLHSARNVSRILRQRLKRLRS